MPDMRCPYHDVVFQTDTNNTKPGSRKNIDGKEVGDHIHPQYPGGISGHVDCPLCKKVASA